MLRLLFSIVRNVISFTKATSLYYLGLLFKGRVSQNVFILSLVPLGIIYGGKNDETARSDLKMVQNCNVSNFIGF